MAKKAVKKKSSDQVKKSSSKRSSKGTSKKKSAKGASKRMKGRPAVKSAVKREKHPYHHHIRYGVLAFAILTVIMIVAIIFSYPQMSKTSDAIATVNGEVITQADLDDQYAKIPAAYKEMVTEDVILEQMINERLLLQEAKKKGITTTEQEVREILDATTAQLGITQEELTSRLSEQGMTMSDLQELYTKQLIITKLVEQEVIPSIDVTDAELKDLYDSRIHARHILVATESEAEAIIKQLDAGADFAELASEYSLDSVASDGDLGEFGTGQMVQEFEDAAFELEVGEITSTPVETNFGYHIIERLPRMTDYESAKETLKLSLQQQAQTDAIADYIKQLKAAAVVTVASSQ